MMYETFDESFGIMKSYLFLHIQALKVTRQFQRVS